MKIKGLLWDGFRDFNVAFTCALLQLLIGQK